MFTIPQPITVIAVKDFISDEVHIVGKATGNPSAVLTFVAVDADGVAVPNAPVATVRLAGPAFNEFYEKWKDESAIYTSLLDMMGSQSPGMAVEGVDLSKVAGVLTATAAEEVLAES